MNAKGSMRKSLLAPCGINCCTCIAYLREKNKCPGCRINTNKKPITRAHCKIKTCDELTKNNFKFCFQCESFPCTQVKQMDKRYRMKYNMSTIDNLKKMKKLGVHDYIKNEKIRWTCSHCGGTICVHRGYCYTCGKSRYF